jgi:hypothetical protein
MTAPSFAPQQKYLGEKGLIALITFLSALQVPERYIVAAPRVD